MKVKKALALYHGKERYNCAQAIRLAFAKEHEDIHLIVEEFKNYGRGLAPDNICGAVYAGITLLKETNGDTEFMLEFETTTGHIRCKDLKSEGKVSCRQCVELVAEILQRKKFTELG